MIYKIVQGNSFVLHICISKVGLEANKQILSDLDLSQASGLNVWLKDMFGGSIKLNVNTSTKSTNEIIAKIPSNLDCGIYGIRLSGTYNGIDFCSAEQKLFSIVASNREGHIPIGIIDGEIGGFVYTKYWIELNGDKKTVLSYYGALSTKNAKDIDVSYLNVYSGVMSNKNFTIRTTNVNDIIWFVSPSPLKFTQNGLPLELTLTQTNGMYYYRTDELTEGDNVITVYTI